ncbi:hypothetical protein V7S43_017545 [Phytophthora oleae]|uniref:Crinkler effector protein N-terminal domain-containing protein n=1 Tax=Phytophthora oleae TaxID=2107226 RepID=A0ABD3ESY9_9STRA
MVKLFCAIVGAAENAFEVNRGDVESVSALKKAIKEEKPNGLKEVDANMLQLFLEKKDDTWLTGADVMKGVKDTSGLKLLEWSGVSEATTCGVV